ncbi:MAG: hypothetical protein KAJ73_00655 [Zetaproteobacteria bacterium]|nr:hypothetical protein [Zetaproteobacteria bacterium]
MIYRVYGIITASVLLGEYDVGSKEEAEKAADADENADWNPSLCHQCSSEVELCGVNSVQIVCDEEEGE